jgi:hypothetical protein
VEQVEVPDSLVVVVDLARRPQLVVVEVEAARALPKSVLQVSPTQQEVG